MKIKEFIEKAIEGGWSRYDTITDIVCSTIRFDDGTSSTDLFKILLDPKAWEAVGKVEAPTGKVAWSEHIEDYGFQSVAVPGWFYQMHLMIDALAEGKSLEEFIETL